MPRTRGDKIIYSTFEASQMIFMDTESEGDDIDLAEDLDLDDTDLDSDFQPDEQDAESETDDENTPKRLNRKRKGMNLSCLLPTESLVKFSKVILGSQVTITSSTSFFPSCYMISLCEKFFNW